MRFEQQTINENQTKCMHELARFSRNYQEHRKRRAMSKSNEFGTEDADFN